MPKVLIVYNGRKGATLKMGEIIAEGIRMSGVEADVVDAMTITKPEKLQGYDGYVFGSATYHGDMMQKMKQVLFMAENAGLEGKVGGAFGAFGWSGEAPDRIYGTMENIFKMDMVGNPLRLKSVLLEGGMEAAQDYGKKVAKKLLG